MLRPLISRRALCGIVALSACLSGMARAEPVPNPEYQSWAKCKPGATVKVAGTSEAMGNKSTQTITTKLVEITPEKAVVETTVSIEMMGQKMDQPGKKRDVPATTAAPDATKPDTSKMDPAMAEKVKAAMKDAKKGEETVIVAGKEYKCATTEVEHEQNGMKTHTKSWNSTEVPGGMVKVEVTTTGAVTSASKMELIEFNDGN